MGERESGLKKRGKKSIENTKAWERADWDYWGLIAQDAMPLLSPPLAGEERIDYLKEILNECPEYYPALFELGYRNIKEGKDEIAKGFIDKGLQSLKPHFSVKDLIDAYYNICEFLEEHLRFEMAIEYYNQLKEIEKDKARVYDSLSNCYVYLGELDKAFETQQKAIELCDSNHRFYCNMGWVEMLRGNLDAAKIMLEKSLQMNQKDQVTINNYEACKLMLKSKRLKNWEAYLLRETDYGKLEKLEDEDNMEGYEFDLIRNPNYTLSKKYDILFTLNYILNFIWTLHPGSFFFYDDIRKVRDYFKPIMHKFIFKTGDIDEEIFNDVYTALLEFYKFLAKHKVVSGYKWLENKMLRLKPELMGKMLRYNEIRHNDEYTKEEKEEVREELFEGDHSWPFL